MRTITDKAVAAFNNGVKFTGSNTCVIVSNNEVSLQLYSTIIAKRSINNPSEVTITTGGYNTNTTKERLNGLNGVSVSTKKGQLYLNGNEWNGNPITIKVQ